MFIVRAACYFLVNSDAEALTLPYLSRWKLRHADCLLGKEYLSAVQRDQPLLYDPTQLADADPRFRWSTINYAEPLVRLRQLQAIQDICNNYDLDGIELDFVKGPGALSRDVSHRRRLASLSGTYNL
jgi:hypothetical protein